MRRKYEKHKLNNHRNEFVKLFDNAIIKINSINTPIITEQLKKDVSQFYKNTKTVYTEASVQNMIDDRLEIRAFSGATLTKSGLIQLRKSLSNKKDHAGNQIHSNEAIQAMVKEISKAHTDIYVAFTPLEQNIKALKKYQTSQQPKNIDDERTDIESINNTDLEEESNNLRFTMR